MGLTIDSEKANTDRDMECKVQQGKVLIPRLSPPHQGSTHGCDRRVVPGLRPLVTHVHLTLVSRSHVLSLSIPFHPVIGMVIMRMIMMIVMLVLMVITHLLVVRVVDADGLLFLVHVMMSHSRLWLWPASRLHGNH